MVSTPILYFCYLASQQLFTTSIVIWLVFLLLEDTISIHLLCPNKNYFVLSVSAFYKEKKNWDSSEKNKHEKQFNLVAILF